MFHSLGLNEKIVKALGDIEITVPTEIQTRSIPLIFAGKDILARSETGSGKTLAFGLPAIQMVNTEESGVEVLIVCPTRELAMQICDEIKRVAKPLGVNIAPVYGATSFDRQIKMIKTSKIIVGTPGRLLDHLNRRTLKLKTLKMLVLDEADEMLNMGFKPDIEKLIAQINHEHQTLMFSATIPNAIVDVAKTCLTNPERIAVGQENKSLEKIEQYFAHCNKNNKTDSLINMIKEGNITHSIVFCNTRKMVDIVASHLQDNGIQAVALHGDMRQSERKRNIDKMKVVDDQTILVATDVAGRGIDIKDIEYVINYDLPNQMENYIHRIGRTGRAGRGGKALTLVNTTNQFNMILDYASKTQSNLKETTNSLYNEKGEKFISKPTTRRDYGNSNRRESGNNSRRDYGNSSRRDSDRAPRRDYGSNNRRDSDRSPRKDYENKPKRDYDRAPRKDYESKPKREFDRSPRKDYESNPKRDYDRAPRKDYESKPKRDYDRAPRKDLHKKKSNSSKYAE